jgi:hypothetical protein
MPDDALQLIGDGLQAALIQHVEGAPQPAKGQRGRLRAFDRLLERLDGDRAS